MKTSAPVHSSANEEKDSTNALAMQRGKAGIYWKLFREHPFSEAVWSRSSAGSFRLPVGAASRLRTAPAFELSPNPPLLLFEGEETLWRKICADRDDECGAGGGKNDPDGAKIPGAGTPKEAGAGSPRPL
jgi:hypothetical protein